MKKIPFILMIVVVVVLFGGLSPKMVNAQSDCWVEITNVGQTPVVNVEVYWNDVWYYYEDVYLDYGDVERYGVDCVSSPDYEYTFRVTDSTGAQAELYASNQSLVAANFTEDYQTDSGDCSSAPDDYLEVGDIVMVSPAFTALLDTLRSSAFFGDPGTLALVEWGKNGLPTFAYNNGSMWENGVFGNDQTSTIDDGPLCYEGLRYWHVDGGWVPDGMTISLQGETNIVELLASVAGVNNQNMIYVTGVDPIQEPMYFQLYATGEFVDDFYYPDWQNLGNGLFAAPKPGNGETFVNISGDVYCGGTGGMDYASPFCSIDYGYNSASSPFVMDACHPEVTCNGYPAGEY